MAKQNRNLTSTFLVPSQFAKLEGVEKALRVKVIAALFPEMSHSFFLL